MDASKEQRLVRINIADPAHETLIEKQRFNRSLTRPKPREERGAIKLESIRPDPSKMSRRFGIELDATELSNVVVDEQAIGHLEDGPCVLAGHAVPKKVTCHSEVYVKQAAIKAYEYLLAMPVNGRDGRTG